MIALTRINGDPVVVNADLIEHLDTTPDTIITLTTGHKIVVRERVEAVVDRVIEFKRAIFRAPLNAADGFRTRGELREFPRAE
jgi:flagellar protein FlbD